MERHSLRAYWLGFALIIAASLAIVGLEAYEGFSSAPELRKDRELVVHTFEVAGTAQALELAVQDAERGQRGFIITGDPVYLDAYQKGVQAAPLLFQKLQTLTSDNPDQVQRMPNLERQMNIKLAELKQTVELRQNRGFDAARQVVQTNSGLTAMRTIDTIIADVVSTENALLKERLSRSAADERITQKTALSSSLLAVAAIVLGILMVLRAAASLRRSESARLSSEEQFRLLVSGVTDYALYMLDPKGNVVSWNAGAERIKGYKASEILGRHFSAFYTEHDRQAGLPGRVLEIAAREGRYEAEAVRMRKDGSRFIAHVVLDPLRDPKGELIGFVKITRDITARVQQQETLEKTRAALAQSQKMEALGQLTGGIAHDFNNLLHVIIGSVDILRRRLSAAEPNLRRLIDTVAQSADRAATLTQQLLAFTRRQPLDPKPIDANRLVAGMSDLLRRTLGESVAVETVLAGGLWRTSVDTNQLENTIVNLAVNARDAMPKGGKLTIETANVLLDEAYAAIHEEVTPGQYVMIAVSDTGSGMTSETIARAFEPFFTTKDPGKGTGLGLSQVFGFIKQSGGHVSIYSEPGAGTTVKLYLPRLAIESETEMPTDQVPPTGGQGTETILLVEDEENVRNFTAEMLRDLGYRVLVAHNGPAALKVLQDERRVNLLLTDVGLPEGFNGRQVADEARRRWPALKVLFMTGYARNAIIHHGRLDAGVELILKPFTQRDVAEKIRHVLDV